MDEQIEAWADMAETIRRGLEEPRLDGARIAQLAAHARALECALRAATASPDATPPDGSRTTK